MQNTCNIISMKKILVIDDNEEIRELFKVILPQSIYKMHFAKDGIEGWEILEKDSVDLVITDYEMPRMNGCELISKINQKFLNLPSLLISTHQLSKDCNPTAQNHYLQKPFNVPELIGIVEKILGN